MIRYQSGMFDETLARPRAVHGVHVLESLRDVAARLPMWRRRSAPETPCAWMAPPPERALPRDLNLPLSAFDPGALGRCTRLSVAGFVDPMVLEQTLHRIPAR